MQSTHASPQYLASPQTYSALQQPLQNISPLLYEDKHIIGTPQQVQPTKAKAHTPIISISHAPISLPPITSSSDSTINLPHSIQNKHENSGFQMRRCQSLSPFEKDSTNDLSISPQEIKTVASLFPKFVSSNISSHHTVYKSSPLHTDIEEAFMSFIGLDKQPLPIQALQAKCLTLSHEDLQQSLVLSTHSEQFKVLQMLQQTETLHTRAAQFSIHTFVCILDSLIENNHKGGFKLLTSILSAFSKHTYQAALKELKQRGIIIHSQPTDGFPIEIIQK